MMMETLGEQMREKNLLSERNMSACKSVLKWSQSSSGQQKMPLSDFVKGASSCELVREKKTFHVEDTHV